ncbi:MAG: phosphohydrolase [Gammaproteobacteria bacterium HGW-Gammaproteobacteria-11]|nr:MAG: phosphohydrolase [Gammaproteobacteria bacterium HGW-Gammaproteobacteria-11]
MSWILTATGKRIDLLRPDPSMICAEDIAHSLSRLCRFNGHTAPHYSVAEHSLRVAAIVPEQYQLDALLHDATEAYVGDMTRPLKQLMPKYQDIEHGIWLAICQRFNLNPVLPSCVREADMIMLATERRDLMPHHPDEWLCLNGVDPLPETIKPHAAPAAKYLYFQNLTDLLANRKPTLKLGGAA